MGGSGLFHEDHVPTIPAFSSLDHATYTAEALVYLLTLKKSANYPYLLYSTFFQRYSLYIVNTDRLCL